ncbi:hypothetical protein GCM10010121_061120 [Streptomyces brasiliensis]|uniref:SDR family NAD(P)-dependent oxidoreductase n=1 Tax=Streptomyces brasiliensis TaxID=1954 RepID=A0A917L2P1_9ACTN|nr:hypothetical protein GCM10010121_061120 [Streptomyces brasiliensis]
MATTQAVLPQFRERGSGVVVDVTSSVVLGHMPLSAVYKASKTAIEGFTASLALELEPIACLSTNFAARATDAGPLEDGGSTGAPGLERAQRACRQRQDRRHARL